MRKATTGEPCAGKPHARFGGRGGESLPYPYREGGGYSKLVPAVSAPARTDLSSAHCAKSKDCTMQKAIGAVAVNGFDILSM